jgi:hypothetical protein
MSIGQKNLLTNGHDWIFLPVKLNNNYEWASYQQSSVVQLPTTGKSWWPAKGAICSD